MAVSHEPVSATRPSAMWPMRWAPHSCGTLCSSMAITTMLTPITLTMIARIRALGWSCAWARARVRSGSQVSASHQAGSR